ncbi:MAG: hypothetical protein B6D64_02115 [Bacteroidetes bacterium 4484_276]|nr:MAG: hypothetical protein B6D64_02115 [Bacteroidetes bacterium 4484_276]
MNTESFLISPASSGERILSLDLLRGIAVLGILIMNIQTFAMIGAAYMNPMAYGDLEGLNKWVWILSHILASNKFMSIFSILFGAGVLIFTSRAIDKGRRGGPLHYRRMMWLFIFGMLHAYLIWYGDILVAYSLCGMLVYVFRKKKPGKLIIASVMFFIVPVLFTLLFSLSMPYWPQESVGQNIQSWIPSAEKIQTELEVMRGGWLLQMDQRIQSTVFMQTFLFLINVFWRVMSMMLLGMALFKWGVLTATKSNSFYLKMVLFGLIPGYLIVSWGVVENFNIGWDMGFSMFIGSLFNYFGSVAVALGYIGVVMLIAKSARCIKFKSVLCSVGKMAFTNYILMSLLGMFIFYGNGLGYFGYVDRLTQILIVFGIWIILLVISPLWLKHFRFGPLEWLWRVLTYWHYQPMKRSD